MKSLCLILAIAIFATSCNNNRGWSAKDRTTFINSCAAEAVSMGADKARAYCECMQPKIEAKYSINEVGKMKPSELQSPEWIAEVKKCLGMDDTNPVGTNGGNPADNNVINTENTGTEGWTGADRTRFVDDCLSAAKDGMGEEKARSYCECMQPKIEAKFKTLAAANQMADTELETDEWKKEVRACLGMDN